MMQSGILGAGFLLGGGLSRLASGAEFLSPSEPGPPYGLDGCRSFAEFKNARRAAGKGVWPVRVESENPSILFHPHLCVGCGHCTETCTDQMTVSHYSKTAVEQG